MAFVIGLSLLAQNLAALASEPGKRKSASSARPPVASWTDDYFPALRKARTENKHALILFTAPERCGACVDLDGLLQEPKVREYLARNFVCIRLHSSSEMGILMRPRFKGGRGVPTLVVVNERGKQLGLMSGFCDGVDEFIRQLSNLNVGKPPGEGTNSWAGKQL